MRGGNSPAAWLVIAAMHVAASWALWRLGSSWSHAFDWEGSASALQPWRVFTAGWVHWSASHLAMNIAGGLVVAALGWTLRLPRTAAYAWLLAWPSSQVAVALLPTPAHLGGLSGTLHAGAAVAAVWLLRTRAGSQRWIGALLLSGLAIKVAWEWWRGPQPILGTSAVTWPAVHLTASLCGCALAMLLGRPPPRAG